MQVIESNAALASETLVPIGKAGNLFPYPVGRTALERWMRHGVRDVKLESILIRAIAKSEREHVVLEIRK